MRKLVVNKIYSFVNGTSFTVQKKVKYFRSNPKKKKTEKTQDVLLWTLQLGVNDILGMLRLSFQYGIPVAFWQSSLGYMVDKWGACNIIYPIFFSFPFFTIDMSVNLFIYIIII